MSSDGLAPRRWKPIPGGWVCESTGEFQKHPPKAANPVIRRIRACEEKKFILALLNRETGQYIEKPYVCLSWRHEGFCRWYSTKVDAYRIREGINRLGGVGRIAYCVWTIDQRREPMTVFECYVDLYHRLTKLVRRMRHEWGEMKFIRTTECHRSGWPHINMLFNGRCADEVNEGPLGYRSVRSDLRDMGIECGFGPVFRVERIRKDAEEMGSYLAKISAEFSKQAQLPVIAPAGFRRIGASPRILPQIEGSGKWVGAVGKWNESGREYLEKKLKAELEGEEQECA